MARNKIKKRSDWFPVKIYKLIKGIVSRFKKIQKFFKRLTFIQKAFKTGVEWLTFGLSTFLTIDELFLQKK